MENHRLLQPLIRPPTTTTTAAADARQGHRDTIKADESSTSIIFRLFLVAFLAIVSIWANYEASKGFGITIVNEAGVDTLARKHFSLFYEKNDEATRIVMKASKMVESFLYPNDSYPKKKVNQVIIKLAGRNLPNKVVVDSGKEDEYVLHLCPSIMEEQNFKHAMLLALQQGTTRIWLWDGQGNAPRNLINGIVEYIVSNFTVSKTKSSTNNANPPTSTTECWKHNDTRTLAKFLNYCERHRTGFIRRLNQAMKDGWHDGRLDTSLGMPVENLCATYNSPKNHLSSTLDH